MSEEPNNNSKSSILKLGGIAAAIGAILMASKSSAASTQTVAENVPVSNTLLSDIRTAINEINIDTDALAAVQSAIQALSPGGETLATLLTELQTIKTYVGHASTEETAQITVTSAADYGGGAGRVTTLGADIEEGIYELKALIVTGKDAGGSVVTITGANFYPVLNATGVLSTTIYQAAESATGLTIVGTGTGCFGWWTGSKFIYKKSPLATYFQIWCLGSPQPATIQAYALLKRVTPARLAS